MHPHVVSMLGYIPALTDVYRLTEDPLQRLGGVTS